MMATESSLDQLLVQVLAGGHGARQSFDQLYRKCYSYVRSLGVPADDARDVVSEVLVKLVQRGPPTVNSNASGYLYRMFGNAAMDWHREQSNSANRFSSTAVPDIPAPRDEHDAEAGEECLRRALAAFAQDSEERAIVLRLTYLEGWSQSRVAEHIGRSYGATREFLYQTRKLFRKLLLDMCGEHLEAGAVEP